MARSHQSHLEQTFCHPFRQRKQMDMGQGTKRKTRSFSYSLQKITTWDLGRILGELQLSDRTFGLGILTGPFTLHSSSTNCVGKALRGRNERPIPRRSWRIEQPERREQQFYQQNFGPSAQIMINHMNEIICKNFLNDYEMNNWLIVNGFWEEGWDDGKMKFEGWNLSKKSMSLRVEIC